MLKLKHRANLGGGGTLNGSKINAFANTNTPNQSSARSMCKADFTLAESTSCYNLLPKLRKAGFTLAEVLITLAIVGVVAALTLPTLMTTINDKVQENQREVIKRKLVQGLNLYNNQEDGLIKHYNNTEEFVRGLSKHLKMAQICGKNDLKNCFPYDKINYLKSDGSTDSVELSSITKASRFQLEDSNYLDPAGFILADGTPFIVTFNSKCSEAKDEYGHSLISPDTPMKEIPTGCLDGIWDMNGATSPNLFGKDVQSLFSAKIGPCVRSINGVCMGTEPFFSTALTSADCNANKSKYGITKCRDTDRDYWGGAMKACKEKGMRLPTLEELAKIATDLYGTTVGSTQAISSGLTLNATKVAEYGFRTPSNSGWFTLWSGQEYHVDAAYGRDFYGSSTGWSTNNRSYSGKQAVCVGE